MFTLKFYSDDGRRSRIVSADMLTILRTDLGAEVTLHQKDGNDFRVDVTLEARKADEPRAYEKVIIENERGQTTEIIRALPVPVAA